MQKIFFYTRLEEEIYMKRPEEMAEVLKENYMYEDILALNKYIYGIVQAECCWFKEYIKTINLKVDINQFKTALVFYTE